MSPKKHMTITGPSKATATLDLQDLADKDVFVPTGGGRSTHYKVNLYYHLGQSAFAHNV